MITRTLVFAGVSAAGWFGLATGAGCAKAPAEAGPGEIARSLLPGADSGLLVRRWQVEDDGRIGAALARRGEAPWLDSDTRDRLARNGFRLVRLHADGIDALREELGGTSVDVEGWHGQAYDWRDVATRAVDDEPRPIAVDGRVRLFEGGRLRLMMRGWTIFMEDGPVLTVELRPEHDRSRRRRPDRVYDRVLGRSRFDGERFDALTFELLMEAGWVYVLTGETPGVEWSAAEAGARRAGAGAHAAGPDVVAPPTVGERLFTLEAEHPRRDLLLIVPRIPDALFPPDDVTTARGRRKGAS
jgi:hypothetical protein